jgi:UDP-N-acetylglucosamine:LPS N-acetylglucosamine transferase
MNDPPQRILLVATAGGHLLQMLALEPAWADLERLWVTDEEASHTHLLDDEHVLYAYGPTPRNIWNLWRNVWLAARTIKSFDPDVILSTGAALAVPFFLVGRLRRRRLVYVESFTRVSQLGMSGRMVYPLVDAFFVQWQKAARTRRALYAGSIV